MKNILFLGIMLLSLSPIRVLGSSGIDVTAVVEEKINPTIPNPEPQKQEEPEQSEEVKIETPTENNRKEDSVITPTAPPKRVVVHVETEQEPELVEEDKEEEFIPRAVTKPKYQQKEAERKLLEEIDLKDSMSATLGLPDYNLENGVTWNVAMPQKANAISHNRIILIVVVAVNLILLLLLLFILYKASSEVKKRHEKYNK